MKLYSITDNYINYLRKYENRVYDNKEDIRKEVSDAKWATWNEIDDLVKGGSFIKCRWEFVKELLKEETAR